MASHTHSHDASHAGPHDHAHEHPHEHDHGHAHDHDHAARTPASTHGHAHDHGHVHGSTNAVRLTLALSITAVFMAVELIGGWWAHSLALIADAGHMLTDAASLGLALYALHASRRPADAVYSYGHHRFEVLAAFVNGLALLAISAWIVLESVQRLFAPQAVTAKLMLVVAALGFVANLGSFLVLRDGHDDMNLRGAVLHVLSDLLGSAAAVVAALVILYTGWVPIDPLLSILVALLIVRGGWRITRQSARILLEGAPTGLDAGEIASDLLAQVPALSGVHHVHAWSLTDARPMLTLHAVLNSGNPRETTLRAIHARLSQRFGIAHATVQLEEDPCAGAPESHGCEAPAH